MKKNISLLIVLILIAATLAGCGGSKYKDGTHAGEGEGMHGPIKGSVEVEDGKIASVEVTEHEENLEYAKPALDQLPDAIVKKNSADLDTITGATFTSDGIKEAVKDALK